MSVCRSCQAPVKWVLTDKKKRMPLDPEPVADGNLEVNGLEVNDDGEQIQTVRVLLKGELESDQLPGMRPPPRYVSHFATCPNANMHRANRKSTT